MDNQQENDQVARVDAGDTDTERLPLVTPPPHAEHGARVSPPVPSASGMSHEKGRPVRSLNGDVGDTEAQQSQDEEPSALDGGYGWVIVLGGFLSQFLAGGLERCDGVYFLELEARFGESAQLTAWPGAICVTVQYFVAPIAAWLCNKFSVRTCIIFGTVLNILGLVLTAFAPNIYLLFVSYSVLQGFGRGLTFSPGLYIVNMYFNKYRGIAVGLTTAGTGVGTFALVPLVDTLFTRLGYQHAFLLTAAIASLGFVVAALCRPLSVHKEIVRNKRLKAAATDDSPSEKQPLKTLRGSLNDAYTADGIQGDKTSSKNHAGSSVENSNGTIRNLPSSSTPINTETRVRVDDTPSQKGNRNCCLACFNVVFPVEGETQGERGPLFHWGLFKDFPFLLLCAGMMFFSLAQKTVLTFLPAMGEDQGLNEIEASLLLSIAGVGDTVGRIASGLILDIPKVRPFRETAYASVLFFAAGAALAVPFSTSFARLCGVGIFFGVVTGASVSQRATVLAALLGKETVTSALGILIMFLGVGTFVGPPLSGALKDISGNFKTAFFMSSGNMAGAGICIALSIIFLSLRKRRQAGNGSQGYQSLEVDESATDDRERRISTLLDSYQT